MKSRVSLTFFLVVVCTSVAAEDRTAQTARKPASAAQLKRAQASAAFKDAVQMLAAQDEVADLSTTEVIAIPKTRDAFAIRFKVARKKSAEPAEFQQMIYVDRPGKSALVYFSGPRFAYTPVTICSSWKTDARLCGGLPDGNNCDIERRCDRLTIEARKCGGVKQTRSYEESCACLMPPDICPEEIELPVS